MGMIVGLDIGGTTTKVVGYESGELFGFLRVKASDPFTSGSGGLGRFLKESGKELSQIDKIHATGVGAAYLQNELFGVPVSLVPEFDCVGLGGLHLSKLKEAIVVSMGTGTSIVAARGKAIEHVIGSGVGGGTLQGLAQLLLNVHDFETISALATQGDLLKVDLNIGDISAEEIPGLTADTTASNFGKLKDLASKEDLAAGIVNLVFQSIGTASVLAARLHQLESVIITGNLSQMPLGQYVLGRFEELYGKRFIIPENAEFATAVGAAIFA